MNAYKLMAAIAVSLLSFSTYAQYVTESFNPIKDGFINSANPSTDHGSAQELRVFQDTGSTISIERSLLSFDLSSIPPEAIIYTATLNLYVESKVDSLATDLYLERTDSLWSQSTLNWGNQPPSVLSNQITVASSSIIQGTSLLVDVTDHVEHMTNYPSLNEGWSIRLQNETGGNDFGVIVSSNENVNPVQRPVLQIGYTMPIEMDINVTHCTPGNNDGAIDATLLGGGVPYHATIYQVNEDTTQIGNASCSGILNYGWSHLDNEIIDYSGLEPGVYFLRIMDSLYKKIPSPTNIKYEFYKYFFVGREGEVTEGMVYPSSRYYEQGGLKRQRRDTIPSIMNGANTNFHASNQHFLGASSSRWPAQTSTELQYDHASLIKYNLQFDNRLNYESAELTLRGWTRFYRWHTSSNATNYSLVTSPWVEDIVTWNTRPTIDSTFKLSRATTPTIGYHTTEGMWDTLELKPFFDYWQQNPTQNHGIELALQNYMQPAYASRDYIGTSANKHFLKVKFTVFEPNTKYWIGATSTDWSDPSNWSDASGGIGGAGVPNIASTVIFDGNGNVNCYHMAEIEVAKVLMNSGYTSIIDFGDFELITNDLIMQNE